MGAVHEVVMDLRLIVRYESPDGEEAQHRGADLVDIVLDKLPLEDRMIHRTRRGDRSLNPTVPGSPRMMWKEGRVVAVERLGPDAARTDRRWTTGHEEASSGPT